MSQSKWPLITPFLELGSGSISLTLTIPKLAISIEGEEMRRQQPPPCFLSEAWSGSKATTLSKESLRKPSSDCVLKAVEVMELDSFY